MEGLERRTFAWKENAWAATGALHAKKEEMGFFLIDDIPKVEPATIPSPMISPETYEKSEPVSTQKRSTQKIEYAIIDALNNINTGSVTPPAFCNF